jgi:hypothetical protein
MEEFAPVTSLRCRRQVAISESGGAVVSNSLSFGIVCEEVFHLVIEIRKVAFNLDDILLWAFRNEEVRMWFYPFCFVNNGDGVAV